MKCRLIVLILIGFTRADNAVDSEFSIFNCPELNSQEEIDLDKIMGKWYVVEILDHKINPLKPMSGSYIVESCPIVELRSLDYSSLRLLWTEEAGNLEYTFRIPDISRKPGIWLSTSLQNGTLTEKQYEQFAGSVHVMKAVASDMVLTFCSRNSFYSLLLSRKHILQKSDKRGVHNLLGRRRLKIINIRETCVNGGAASRRGTIELVTWMTLIGLLSSCVLFGSRQ